jgi:hypothetical protein
LLAEMCKFLYDFFFKSFSKIFFRFIRKNVYPLHKPVAVDYTAQQKTGHFLSPS